jgi:putative transcriptional regulator
MAVNYNRLFKILEDRSMTKTQMREALKISTSTLAKLSSNRPVTLDVLERICEYFDVNAEEIFEFTKNNIRKWYHALDINVDIKQKSLKSL